MVSEHPKGRLADHCSDSIFSAVSGRGFRNTHALADRRDRAQRNRQQDLLKSQGGFAEGASANGAGHPVNACPVLAVAGQRRVLL
jgi:hypothetical protein